MKVRKSEESFQRLESHFEAANEKAGNSWEFLGKGERVTLEREKIGEEDAIGLTSQIAGQ